MYVTQRYVVIRSIQKQPNPAFRTKNPLLGAGFFIPPCEKLGLCKGHKTPLC